ncbi:MAG: hypothetical protein JRD89_02030 [Deltaproteobacteria bacterium]|nr:hypothetical protein [Deltaproteobacteria bacterium]
MKISEDTKLYIVADDGISEMNLVGLYNAMGGGLMAHKVQIFTIKGEADIAMAVATRYRQVKQFTREHMGAATAMVLFGENSEVLEKVEFDPLPLY